MCKQKISKCKIASTRNGYIFSTFTTEFRNIVFGKKCLFINLNMLSLSNARNLCHDAVWLIWTQITGKIPKTYIHSCLINNIKNLIEVVKSLFGVRCLSYLAMLSQNRSQRNPETQINKIGIIWEEVFSLKIKLIWLALVLTCPVVFEDKFWKFSSKVFAERFDRHIECLAVAISWKLSAEAFPPPSPESCGWRNTPATAALWCESHARDDGRLTTGDC